MTLSNIKTSTQKEFILDVVPLDKGYSVTVSKTIKLAAGNYILNGLVDYNDAVKEANENNNNAPTGYVTAAFPDLVIEKLVCYPEEPKAGDKFFCIMNLTNKGIGKKGSAPHKIKLEFKNIISFLGKKTYIIDWTYEIASGSIWFPKQLEISLPVGKYRVEATADYKNQVHESNEGNNSISIDLKVKL
jgi:subtilase family serine protease